MRLLHVIHDLSPAKGGPAENLLQLSYGYAEVGIHLEVLTLDPPDAAYLARYPFPVHALGGASSKFGYNRAELSWLRAHIRSFDAVVVDGLWHYSGAAVRKAARASGVPYLVFPHGMLDPWFKRTYPGKHVKKQIFWWLAQAAVLRDAYRVVFTSEEERDLAAGTFRPSHWTSAVIPLGIRRPSGDPHAQAEAFYTHCPQARGRRFLLFLSRIHPKKGCDLLLKAFCTVAPAHPELDLVMAGPDPEHMRPALEAIPAEAGLAGRVHWVGMLQGDTKWGAFHAADAFVLPSHQENFGIAVAEAIACRLPVLLSNQINIFKYILEDETGFVEDDTEAGTLRLIERWLALKPEEKAAIAARADDSFDKRFSVLSCAARIRGLVERANYASTAQLPSSSQNR